MHPCSWRPLRPTWSICARGYCGRSTSPKTCKRRSNTSASIVGRLIWARTSPTGCSIGRESELLGSSGLHTRVGVGAREIGYWVHKDFLNQGLTTEATVALTKVAFVVDHVERVEIHCDPENVRSLAVPRKLGFCHEATLRHRTRTPDGRPRDTMVWTLLAHESSD